MPDSISMTGLKVTMMLSSNPPLFIPDSTFRENVNFHLPKVVKNRGKSMVFSAHGSGLTLGNSLGAFRHKQDFHRCKHDF